MLPATKSKRPHPSMSEEKASTFNLLIPDQRILLCSVTLARRTTTCQAPDFFSLRALAQRLLTNAL